MRGAALTCSSKEDHDDATSDCIGIPRAGGRPVSLSSSRHVTKKSKGAFSRTPCSILHGECRSTLLRWHSEQSTEDPRPQASADAVAPRWCRHVLLLVLVVICKMYRRAMGHEQVEISSTIASAVTSHTMLKGVDIGPGCSSRANVPGLPASWECRIGPDHTADP